MGIPVATDTARVGPLITGAAWLAGAAALALVAFPRLRNAAVAGGAAAGSLAATLIYDGPADNRTALWWLAELLASGLTLRLVVRRAPRRAAALGGTLMFAAITVLPLRLTLNVVPPATTRGAVAGCLLCGLVAAGIAAGGLYPRYLTARRSAAVAEARRAQRLDLARDLHDFVAHDVSGIIVQAQAAQFAPDPEAARAALQRIEDAGLRAMASLDRTVHMLHDDEPGDGYGGEPRPRPLGLADLAGLTDRFAETCGARIQLTVAVDDPPHEVSATAYRLVVEALTNIRRHASDVTTIDVTVTGVPGPAVRVRVADDGRARPRVRRRGGPRGGRGLGGLADRVEAVGGEFTAGPLGDHGWEVTAVLPLPRGVRSPS
ncbi:sensor histidine kinase [Actinoallomurus sp. CA-150999]|uniref:sensor histidine kinase n=1 Tax=Actinoallomurus sp. CA-150999 TaxID=3239887 RepID=UPI003D8AA1F9